MHLLSLCIIISPPCFLQLILDVILIQFFVVTDHKFFGKVLQEIKKKPVKKGGYSSQYLSKDGLSGFHGCMNCISYTAYILWEG